LLRNKSLNLQRIKTRLTHQVDAFESENKLIDNFKTELNLLNEERQSHLEELKQIDADIAQVNLTKVFIIFLKTFLFLFNLKDGIIIETIR
jgi:hypothetical protein